MDVCMVACFVFGPSACCERGEHHFSLTRECEASARLNSFWTDNGVRLTRYYCYRYMCSTAPITFLNCTPDVHQSLASPRCPHSVNTANAQNSWRSLSTTLKMQPLCFFSLFTRVRAALPVVLLPVQVACGICHPWSGHLFERLANAMTLTIDFCDEFYSECSTQLGLAPTYCDVHTGGGDEDAFYAYPYVVDGESERHLHARVCVIYTHVASSAWLRCSKTYLRGAFFR